MVLLSATVRVLWPFLVYLALSLLMTWPLALHAGSGLPSGGDALLQAWTIAWDVHALRTSPGAIWNAPIFYPYPDTLAYTDNHLLLATLTAPLTLASGQPLLAHNVLVLLSFALSGWAVYLLARDTLHDTGAASAAQALTLSPSYPPASWAALLAGAAFAFCAYRFAHLSQLNLLQTAWMIFALVFLRRLLRPLSAGGGRLGDALLGGLFAGIQAATALYYAFFAAALLGGYALLWASEQLWHSWRRRSPLPWRQAALALLAGALGVAVALPFGLPYARVYATLGIVRSLRELDNWSAPLRAYASVTGEHLLYAPLGERVVDAGEMVLFPGLLVGALALGGIGMIINAAGRSFFRSPSARFLPWGRDWVFWPLVAGAAFLLSLGTGLRLERYSEPLPLPLPYLLLYERLPGFGALRVPARWGLLVTLAAALLAALALATLLARLPRRARTLVGLTCLALVLLEQAAPPLSMPRGPTLLAAPPVYAWLGEPAQNDVRAVLELPVAAVPRGAELERVSWRQWYGRLHWRPLAASYSGLVPFGTSDLLARAEDLPAAESLSLLQLAGVDTLVLHRDQFAPEQLAVLEAGLAAAPTVRYRADVGTSRVYTLLPDPRLEAIVAAAGAGGAIVVSADERVPGLAALALVRRLEAAGHELYGNSRPRYYGPLRPPRPGQVFAAGLLAADEDSRERGFAPAQLRWSAHGLALYQGDPALRVNLSLAQPVPGAFHPSFPNVLELQALPDGLRVGGQKLPWSEPAAELQLELDVASLSASELRAGELRVQLPPGLSVVRLPLAAGTSLQLSGAPEQVALRRLRVLAGPSVAPQASPEPGLAASVAVSLANSLLDVRVRGAGASGALLDVRGAAAYDDRPILLLSGAQPLAAQGGELRFEVDLLRAAAPWLQASEPPRDGRYLVYLRNADKPNGPGQPVAKFNIRNGQLADFEPVPLPLTAVP